VGPSSARTKTAVLSVRRTGQGRDRPRAEPEPSPGGVLAVEVGYESATQFNREYSRFWSANLRCEIFERFFPRMFRNLNWSERARPRVGTGSVSVIAIWTKSLARRTLSRVLRAAIFSEATVGFWVIIVPAVLPMSCLSIRVRPLLRRSNGETAIEYPLTIM